MFDHVERQFGGLSAPENKQTKWEVSKTVKLTLKYLPNGYIDAQNLNQSAQPFKKNQEMRYQAYNEKNMQHGSFHSTFLPS